MAVESTDGATRTKSKGVKEEEEEEQTIRHKRYR
jgi:hypothetical protein